MDIVDGSGLIYCSVKFDILWVDIVEKNKFWMRTETEFYFIAINGG